MYPRSHSVCFKSPPEPVPGGLVRYPELLALPVAGTVSEFLEPGMVCHLAAQPGTRIRLRTGFFLPDRETFPETETAAVIIADTRYAAGAGTLEELNR